MMIVNKCVRRIGKGEEPNSRKSWKNIFVNLILVSSFIYELLIKIVF